MAATRRTYVVNGLDLDAGTYRLLESTQASAGLAPRLASVEVYGRDGAVPVGGDYLAAGELGLVVAVATGDFAARLDAEARVGAALRVKTSSGLGQVVLKGPGIERECGFRLKSLAWQEKTPGVSVGQIVLDLPRPIWQAPLESRRDGLAPGVVEFEELAGGSAPVEVTWLLPGGVPSFNASCVVSGETTRFSTSRPTVGETMLRGLGRPVGVDQWGRVWPDREGRYRARVSGGGVKTFGWKAKKSWL
ncbi:MAG: hypothetical protein Q4B10_05950 [Actinomycetaceae bacterium]|nr:hypothetical protein [Actinomycetaceae bacterium]